MMDFQTPGLRVNSNLLRAYWAHSGGSPSLFPAGKYRAQDYAAHGFEAAALHFMPPLE